jgi:UDP-N-acetylglucosamine transferase subunit ALG13
MKMDEIAGKIDENVIMQIGYSHYKPLNAEYFEFTDDFENIRRLNGMARVIVSHAGAGSIITALQAGTPVLIVPRLKKFNEHIDDHQLEISEALSDNPLVKVIYDLDELESCLGLKFDIKDKRRSVNDLALSLKKYLREAFPG